MCMRVLYGCVHVHVCCGCACMCCVGDVCVRAHVSASLPAFIRVFLNVCV